MRTQPHQSLERARKRPGLVLAGTAVALATALAGGLTVPDRAAAAPVQNPAVVPVGSGSYASAPPAALDSDGHDVSGTVDQPLYIDSSQSGKPVPTNAWWTDLLVSRYSGALWADPLVASNSESGTTLAYPTTWNADGTALTLDHQLQVQGTVVPAAHAGDVVMADFEAGYPQGWTTTGDAFTGTPAQGGAPGQSPVSGFLGDRLADSFTAATGDGATGTLRSPDFTVDRSHLVLLVGGGNHPGQEEVRLVVGGQTVQAATGKDSEQLDWVDWDLSSRQGQTAHLEVVDSLTAGWGHVLLDQVVRTDDTTDLATRYSTQFHAADARALRWGEWNLTWRMTQQGGTQHMDVTAARGVPYVWFEFTQMQPRVVLEDGATVTGLDGAPVTFPVTTSTLAVTQGGRTFGLHLPDGTRVDRTGNHLDLQLARPYMVVSAVPASGLSLADLQAHAFAIPRDTTMTYAYDPVAGDVAETWALDTQALQGTSTDTVQGWLPHHYDEARTNLSFTGATYATPRGTLKTTVGHGGWVLHYQFEGLTPVAPTPQQLGLDDDYDPAQMRGYVDAYAQRTTYGGDTYWGGKDVLQLAEYMAMAAQIGDTAAHDALKASLTAALDDWFTYTPGETEHFFARYPTWKALIGFGDSYGSFQFTDNHFHYGYFTLAAGLLALDDPQWGQKYGAMATLVAEQYAGWDRTSQDFPYLRTFDTWEGHSYAGGFSSPGGNNQESSSEAIQSWVGLFMLGTALGNTAMQATGAMGYVTERAAVREYYLDYRGSTAHSADATVPSGATTQGPGNHPAAYGHATTGILFDSGQAYATYFSADPAWIYGIQWMPTGPWFNYLGWDPAFARELLADMNDERPQVLGQFVAGDDGADLARAAKQWYGVGTDYGADVTLDKDAAVRSLTDAVRNAYQANPAYVTARTAANPLYDAATGRLLVTVAADGTLTFPADVWSPGTLPAAWQPVRPPSATPDADPTTWATAWAPFRYLSTGYTPDAAALRTLYSYDVRGYQPGADTQQAADVYSREGDALGNVVLGYVAQTDPDQYADVIAELTHRSDPVATATSMAGAVYYDAMSNRGLGREVLDRHVATPTAQVYKKGTTYTYVVYNPTDRQQSYPVLQGTTQIGTIAVPAHTQVAEHLDAHLARIDVTASGHPTTVTPGSTVTFTATGYDQYGATVPLDGLTWSASAGGTVSGGGTFTATTAADPVVVTAAVGGVRGTYTLRVGDRPTLAGITVTPGFARVVTGSATTFQASGVDQYGDPFALGGVQWSASGTGTVSASGVLTAGAPGAGTVTATSGGVSGAAVVAVTSAPTNVAQGRPATASSVNGASTAALAVDGDPTTRWESAWSDGQWIQVDLGRDYEITHVDATWETAAPAAYDVQVADSATGPWRTLTSVTKADASKDSLDVSGTGRYLRLAAGTRLTAYGVSLWELGVQGVPAGDAVTPATVLVQPPTAYLPAGGAAQLRAYAFAANGDGGAVTPQWSVVSGPVSVTSDGRVTATGRGTATVRATYQGVTGTATLAVGGAPTGGTGDGPGDGPGDGGTGTPGTPTDVALGRPATASSVTGASTAALAVDGDAGTRWESAWSDGQWLQVDLGARYDVSSVEIDWETAAAAQFSVQVADDPAGPWTTLATRTKQDASADTVAVTGTGRYVRVDAPTRLTQWGVSIWSLHVLGVPHGGSSGGSTGGGTTTPPSGTTTEVAHGRPATASSTYGGNTAALAVDGDAGTRWESDRADGQWLQVDLGARVHLSSVEIDWEAAAAARFSVQVADDPAGPWTTLATRTKQDASADTVAVDGTGRYLRIDAPTRLTQWGVSVWGLRAYGSAA